MDIKQIRDFISKIEAHKGCFKSRTKEQMTIIEDDWYRAFRCYDNSDVNVALDNHLKTSERIPTIYHIREELKLIHAQKQKRKSGPKRQIGFQNINFETLLGLFTRQYCPILKMGSVSIHKNDYEKIVSNFDYEKMYQRVCQIWNKIMYLDTPEIYVEATLNSYKTYQPDPQEFFSELCETYSEISPIAEQASKLNGKDKLKFWLKNSGLGGVVS